MSSKPLHDVLKWSSRFLSVARRFQTRIVEMPKNLYALQNKGMMYKLDAELAFVRIKHIVPMADVESDVFSILHPKNDVAVEVERRIEKKFSWNNITAPAPIATAPSASNSLSTAGGTASAAGHGSAGDTADHGSAGDSAGHGFGHGSDESAGATASPGSDSKSAPLSPEHGDEEVRKRRRC
ncbi:hypothetical protein ACP4OV_012963 [Aristida adscensionis]